MPWHSCVDRTYRIKIHFNVIGAYELQSRRKQKKQQEKDSGKHRHTMQNKETLSPIKQITIIDQSDSNAMTIFVHNDLIFLQKFITSICSMTK